MTPSFRRALGVVLILGCISGTDAFATSFIVPTDAELIAKSDAVIEGVVISSRVVESDAGMIETLYDIDATRWLKGGPRAAKSIVLRSPGGRAGERFVIVNAAAHFAQGEDVLLFLTAHGADWTPTDMTLGKFRKALTTRGYSVFVRDDEDITGLRPDAGKVRLESSFVRFIEATVRGEESAEPYEIEAADVIAPGPVRDGVLRIPEAFAPSTYSTSVVVEDEARYGVRWPAAAMEAGVRWATNLAGGDARIAAAKAALSFWTSDEGSAVNLAYAGTSSSLVANDGRNVIAFDDPQGLIPGTWRGSGVVATTFVYGSGTHDFGGGKFLNIVGADIVVQDGYAANDLLLRNVLTHEAGHAIGLRHSDGRDQLVFATRRACAADCGAAACDPAVEECSAVAMMRAAADATRRSELRSWDVKAARALYPVVNAVPLPPTNVTAVSSSELGVYVSWSGSDGATSYTVWRSDGGPYMSLGPPSPPAATSFLDQFALAGSSYLYAVQAHNGSGDSALSSADIAARYTDPTLTAGMTIRAVHLTELRAAANLLLASTGFTFTYTDPTIVTGSTVAKAIHFQEVEYVLRQARANLGLSVPAPLGIAVGGPITAAVINTLRSYTQ